MRVNKSILAILAASFIAMASSSAIAESKIGVADPQRAILQSEIGKQGVQQINAQYSEQDDMLKEMQKDWSRVDWGEFLEEDNQSEIITNKQD